VTAGKSLLSLINQLLDFSRLQAKGFRVADRAPFDVLDLLLAVRALLQHQAEQKGLRLLLSVAADVPPRMLGDEALLREILTNLVGQCGQVHRAGSVTISVALEQAPAGAVLRLEVVDTGIGIAPEAQERIFGSFAQADDSIIDRFGGTGLGLAISRQLAGLMGGEIGVESAVGGGSRFWFTAALTPVEEEGEVAPSIAAREARVLTDDPALVAAIAAALPGIPVVGVETGCALVERAGDGPAALFVDARLLAAQNIAGAGLASGIGYPAILVGEGAGGFVTRIEREADAATIRAAARIACRIGWPHHDATEAMGLQAARKALSVLIADDNPVNRKVFRMILTRAGHSVEEAVDGEEALDRMRDERFDLVLMDVNMPKMTGIDATRLYRFAALGQARLPIVGVTADASEDTRARCIDVGMDDCITKPVDSEVLLALVDRLGVASAPAPSRSPMTRRAR
jgi:two-component system sensor histidine kinase RpfC